MLNNRWFVIALSVAALAMVGLRVVKPLLADREAPFIPDDPDYYALDIDSELTGTGIDTPLQGLQFDSAQRDIRSIDVASLQWQERPGRDPYSPAPRVTEAVLDAVRADVSKPVMTPSAIRWPAVTAVVDSRKHQYAVVDGVIRKPGERFGGFRLAEVGERGVHVVHAASQQSRHLKVDAQ
ncbi:MAG: hypothetical protein AAFY69_01695 [Pseudomonadota bacterium]